MKKKLMAAAVAGALAAPAAALAQVQIYGVLNVEYAPYVDNIDTHTGQSRATTDEINSGASRIGFRGQEKLGGGLTAWFQCETDVEFLDGGVNSITANSQTTWCHRNSALGLRGSWGTVFIGTWDTPAKRVTTQTRMLNETGWFGAQRLLMTATTPSPVAGGGGAGFNYSHRLTKSINYESPTMNGFTFAVTMTTENPSRNLTDNIPGIEGRVWGVNGIYSSGPLLIGAAYMKYENQVHITPAPATVAAGQGIDGADDEIMVLGATYRWGNFKIGGTVTQLELDPSSAAADETERRNYNLALDWALGGPNTLRFGWTHAGETEGPGAAGCATCGSANQYQVSLIHRFSKRTSGAIGYVLLDNGDGGAYNLQALATTSVRSGDKAQAIVLQYTHTF